MAQGIVHAVGKLLIHMLGVLLLCWRAMVLAGVFAALITLVVAELCGVLVTGQLPMATTHAVAILLAVAVAYCAAMTTFLIELVRGVGETIRLLEGEAEAGLRAARLLALNESTRFGFGRPTAEREGPRRPPASGTATPASIAAGMVAPREDDTDVTLLAVAEDLGPAAPPLRAQPVRADRLPRIEWTWEHPVVHPEATPAASTAPADPDELDTAPRRPAVNAQSLPAEADPAGMPDAAPQLPATSTPTPTWTPELARVAALLGLDIAEDDTIPTHDASDVTQLADGPRFGLPASITRPLRAVSQPLLRPPSQQGVWGKLGDVLIGRRSPLAAPRQDGEIGPEGA